MPTITIELSNADNEELLHVVSILNGVIESNNKKEEEWKNTRNRKKKKTVDELIQEIDEEIDMERNSIIDSNIEIENLENKRKELEKLEENPTPAVIKKIVKPVKKKKPIQDEQLIIPDH